MGAGTIINNYAIGDTNFDAMMNTLDATRRGYQQVTLTESTTTTIPKVAAGSVIEIGGALYEFTSDSTLAGAPSDGACYIRCIPTTSAVTCDLSSIAPTWSDAKQGWYGTGGSAGYRYLETIKIYKSSGYRKYYTGKEYTCFIRLSSDQFIANASMMWGSATRDDFLMYSTASTTTRTYFPIPFSGVYTVLAQLYSSHGGGWRSEYITYAGSTNAIANNGRVQTAGDAIEQVNARWDSTVGGDFRVHVSGTYYASTLVYSGSFFSIWSTPSFP